MRRSGRRSFRPTNSDRCSNAVPRRWWTTCTGHSPASGRSTPQGDVLELQASAGLYTHLDGPHSRVPVGQYKIGLIAQERKPHLTNTVVGDPRVSDQEWAQREGMVAFAGYPLIVEDRLVGVMAMFARHPFRRPRWMRWRRSPTRSPWGSSGSMAEEDGGSSGSGCG